MIEKLWTLYNGHPSGTGRTEDDIELDHTAVQQNRGILPPFPKRCYSIHSGRISISMAMRSPER